MCVDYNFAQLCLFPFRSVYTYYKLLLNKVLCTIRMHLHVCKRKNSWHAVFCTVKLRDSHFELF